MAAWCRAWCRLPPARQHNKGINEGPRWRGGAGLSCAMCPRSGDMAPLPVISVLISQPRSQSPSPETPCPARTRPLGWAGLGVLMMKCSQLQPGSAQCIYTASPAPAPATRLLANKIVRGCFSSRTRIPSQPPSHSTHFSRWLDPASGRHWSRTKCPANAGPRSTTQHSAGRGEPSIPGPSSRPGPSSSCSLALF